MLAGAAKSGVRIDPASETSPPDPGCPAIGATFSIMGGVTLMAYLVREAGGAAGDGVGYRSAGWGGRCTTG